MMNWLLLSLWACSAAVYANDVSEDDGHHSQVLRRRLQYADASQPPSTQDEEGGDERCYLPGTLETPYNGVREVPPFVGIMFSIYAKQEPIEILTLELDVLLNNGNLTDKSVEVYTMAGTFEDYVNNADAWQQVANSELVLAPGGHGVIIPTDDFKPISVQAYERQSLYVTLKGRFLDHTVNALNRLGDTHQGNEDLKVLVGAGLTEYKFPEDFDHRLFPHFAGVIHYRKACAEGEISTDVEYKFLPSENVPLGLLPDINQALDEAFDRLWSKNSVMKDYEKTHMVRRVTDSTRTTPLPYDGHCPEDWESCASSAISATITVAHSSTLSSDELLDQLYRFTNKLTTALEKVLPDYDIHYVGLKTKVATFDLDLFGVNEMEQDQEDFLKVSTRKFLKDFFSDSQFEVFDVYVEGQEEQPDGSLKVRGTIDGAEAGYLREESFVAALFAAFHDGGPHYVDWIHYDTLKPSEVRVKNPAVFHDIAGASASFEPVEENFYGKDYSAGIALALLLVMVLVLGHLVFRSIDRAKYRRALQARREKRKEMDRQRKEEKKLRQVERGEEKKLRKVEKEERKRGVGYLKVEGSQKPFKMPPPRDMRQSKERGEKKLRKVGSSSRSVTLNGGRSNSSRSLQ